MSMQILIVDDDLDDIDMLRESILGINSEIECKTALDGVEALVILNTSAGFRPDYIFLDLNMPRMGGKELLAGIKNDNRFRDIPVFIYTTSRHDNDKKETLSLGADYFITKPNTIKELNEVIAFVLSQDWTRTSDYAAKEESHS